MLALLAVIGKALDDDACFPLLDFAIFLFALKQLPARNDRLHYALSADVAELLVGSECVSPFYGFSLLPRRLYPLREVRTVFGQLHGEDWLVSALLV